MLYFTMSDFNFASSLLLKIVSMWDSFVNTINIQLQIVAWSCGVMKSESMDNMI